MPTFNDDDMTDFEARRIDQRIGEILDSISDSIIVDAAEIYQDDSTCSTAAKGILAVVSGAIRREVINLQKPTPPEPVMPPNEDVTEHEVGVCTKKSWFPPSRKDKITISIGLDDFPGHDPNEDWAYTPEEIDSWVVQQLTHAGIPMAGNSVNDGVTEGVLQSLHSALSVTYRWERFGWLIL